MTLGTKVRPWHTQPGVPPYATWTIIDEDACHYFIQWQDVTKRLPKSQVLEI